MLRSVASAVGALRESHKAQQALTAARQLSTGPIQRYVDRGDSKRRNTESHGQMSCHLEKQLTQDRGSRPDR